MLQRVRAFGLWLVHPTQLAAPGVDRRIAEIVPAAPLNMRPSLSLLQNLDDLLTPESLHHVHSLL